MNKLFFTSLLLCGFSQAAVLEEMQDQTYPIAPNATISVRNTDGTLFVYGWDNSALRVIARKRAYTKARLDGIAIKVKAEGETASIETIFPVAPKGLSAADRSGTVDYVILVPERSTLSRVELATGEIIVQGLRGPKVNARLTNGRLAARNCFSEVHLTVANGSMSVFFDWWEATRTAVMAEIGHGHIWALLPASAGLHVDAVSGDGQITNGFAREGERRSPSLQTIIGNGEAELKLRAGSGNIEIQKID